MKPKILVLGGSGFVGREVVRALHKNGHSVRATYRTGESEREIADVKDKDIEWIEADLEKRESIKAALQGCVAVIHAAGYEPGLLDTVNDARKRGVGQLRSVFDECLAQGVLRIVYVSSISTMNSGESGRVYDETDFYTPGQFSGAYFEAKYSMEAELYRYFDKGLEIVVVLPSVILGPGCADTTGGEILKDILRHPRRDVGEDLEGELLNVVDVRDVASALVAALERGRAGRRYTLGGINTDQVRVTELFRQALEDKGLSVESFLRGRSQGGFIEELAEKVSSLGARQIAEQVSGYLPEQLTENISAWKMMGRRTDMETDKPRWYSVHVNSQRARGELGHRPRLLAQLVDSSIEPSVIVGAGNKVQK